MKCDFCEEELRYDYVKVLDEYTFCDNDCRDAYIEENSSLIDISRN
ncbi:MAG: hypothetical protein ACRC18_06490 [Cetobacterium sp.]